MNSKLAKKINTTCVPFNFFKFLHNIYYFICVHLVCGHFVLWPFGLLPFWFVPVSVCGRIVLWPFRFVAVSVCGRFGLWPFGLWPFRFVVVSVCGLWQFRFLPFRCVAVMTKNSYKNRSCISLELFSQKPNPCMELILHETSESQDHTHCVNVLYVNTLSIEKHV